MLLKHEWIDVSLDDVLKHFANDFTAKDGSTVFEHTAFVDTGKHRVVFKLTMKAPEAS